jgi:hypothetical protein
MFQHTVQGDISILRTDIGNFCAGAGFTKVCEDTTSLTYSSGADYNARYAPGTGNVTISGLGSNSNYYKSPANGTSWPAYRIVLKDPAGNCYIHLLFYTYNLDSYRDGTLETAAYMDYYLSTGWNGSGGLPDNHPGLIKLGVWYNLPTNFTGLDLFAGTNSEGKLWAHFALEEKPLVFSHLGIGTFEKFLDFTGGDYIQASMTMSIYGLNWNNTVFPYGMDNFLGNGNFPQNKNGYYAPDLDTPNKKYPGSLYRSTNGQSYPAHERVDCERGATSLQITNYNQAVDQSMEGGELSIKLFPLPNPWSGTSPLVPIYILATDGNDFTYHGVSGYFPGVRTLNVFNYNPKDEISLGNDVWKIYPARTKIPTLSPNCCTQNQGYAVLKNG